METLVKQNPILTNEVSFEQRAKDIKLEKEQEQEKIRNQRKSPFTKFYQINKEHSENLMWLCKENPNAYRILLFLLKHMDNYNAVMCSYQVLQEALELGRTTASTSIKFLKEHGFIHVVKSGTSNVYIVNNDLAWSSWGTNYQFCEFPANIIISASEQEERKKVKDKKIKTVIKK